MVLLNSATPGVYLGSTAALKVYYGSTQVWASGGGEGDGPSTFTGADGDPWPSDWTTFGATVDIQSNTGRTVTGTSSYATAGAHMTGSADGGLLVKWQWSIAGSERLTGIGFRFGTTPESTGYEVLIYQGGQVLRRYNSGISDIAFQAGSFATATWYWTRAAWSGSTLQARTWADGGSEPGTWNVTATDATFGAAGRVMLRGITGGSGGAQTTLFDDFSLAG